MTLDEIIQDFRDAREKRSQSTFASDRVFRLLDAYDAISRDALNVIGKLTRLLLPTQMMLAEFELLGEPVAGDKTLFSFMGSGASDMVTVGEFREAIALAGAYMGKYRKGEDDDRKDQ